MDRAAAVDRSCAASRNVFVDTTDVFDRKLAALLSHESQIPDPRVGRDGAARAGAAVNAEIAGLPDGRLRRAVPRHRRRGSLRTVGRSGRSGDEAEARDRGEAVVACASTWRRSPSDCHTSPDAVPNAAWVPKPSSAAVSMLPVIQSVTRSNGVSPWIEVR